MSLESDIATHYTAGHLLAAIHSGVGAIDAGIVAPVEIIAQKR